MDDSLVVFTYAPAGLGHLRVVDSLAEGLVSNTTPVLLGSSDKGIGAMHKFTSINPFARSIMEWVQRGEPQNLFTLFYRNFLRSTSGTLYSEIVEAINERLETPKNIIFVCTHFGIAHKISVIKEKLEKQLHVKTFLVVQVTDDSPQYIWYVPGADLICVPSEYTKKELLVYAKKNKLDASPIMVLPYPINPFLSEKLSQNRFMERTRQLSKTSETTVHISLPISGAAVSMDFFKHLINRLHSKSRPYMFHIVSRLAPFTKKFLKDVQVYDYVKIYSSSDDKKVVDMYDDLYKKEIISLEITKPSEQAFKSLTSTEQIGGSIILFSKPIGRQEYDNLDFLRRHQMLFSKEEQEYLWQKARKSESISDMNIANLFDKKRRIRGVELPMGSDEAAGFIWWCLKHGVFEKMLENGIDNFNTEFETQPTGVKLFWDEVRYLISKSGR
jgi:hypothetical protein